MKVLIDTNVIVDALQNRVPFAQAAQQIFELRACERFEGFITAKAAADIYCLIHRHTHDDAAARAILLKLFRNFEPLGSAAADCIAALASPLADYEDPMMVETAGRTGMDCIVTRDKDYTKSSVPIFSPAAFLSLLQQEEVNCMKTLPDIAPGSPLFAAVMPPAPGSARTRRSRRAGRRG